MDFHFVGECFAHHENFLTKTKANCLVIAMTAHRQTATQVVRNTLSQV
ncbi:hypothetical protein [Helicobacter sp. UBA3407]|nr:hypothetical protein [Helicobacter sp. UBA3407]